MIRGAPMRVLVLLIQLAMTFIAVALALPPILVHVPASRDAIVGPALALAIGVIVFALLRFIWPGRRA
jgi:hypothetical protein